MKTFLRMVLLIAALTLSCCAQAAKNILVFGDSLSAGYGVAREASWVHLLQQELQQSHPQYRIVNASVSGETTAGGLSRIGKSLQQHRPAVLILELGANDGLRGQPLSATEKNLNKIIRRAQKAGAQVLLLGIQLPPNYGPEYTAEFRAIYPRLAKQDHVALVPFLLEGVPPDQFQADNLHPNEAAQPLVMRNVLQHLRPLLR